MIEKGRIEYINILKDISFDNKLFTQLIFDLRTRTMLLISICMFLIVCNDFLLTIPISLSEIKYPLTREEAFKKLEVKSDFIFDFYNPRDIDIIKGADAGRTVRAKVSWK